MSNKTWLEEFYPVEALTMAESSDNKAIILHARQKWTGLLPENLEKHGVFFIKGELCDERHYTFLDINSSSCGLCEKYIERYNSPTTLCPECPLNKMLGHPCDEGDDDPNDGGIYWEALKNPQVMIDALNKVLDTLE